MSIAIVFPGQGTQEPGMGAPWKGHPAWGLLERAESVLGEPLAPLVLDAGPEALSRTRDAQLAILVTSLVAWEAVRERIPEPVAFAGHSLGQVSALVAAGVLDLAAGMRFAAHRAERSQAAIDRHPGRMTALLGAATEQAEEACRAAPDACWLANDNAPGQVVIAGTPDGVARAGARAKDLGVRRIVPLDVGGAFHTPLMREAADALAHDLAAMPFAAARIPIASNYDGALYDDAEGWRVRSSEHLAVPVRWRAVQETLAGLGVTTLVEVGHGATLTALAKRTLPDVAVRSVASPDDLHTVSGIA